VEVKVKEISELPVFGEEMMNDNGIHIIQIKI